MSSGGSSKTYTQDYAYNQRLATIQEDQQKIADEYFDFWQQNQAPLEKAQAEANLSLVPLQTETERQTLEAQASLLPMETELAKNELQTELDLMPQKTELAQSHIAGSQELIDLADVNVEDRVGQATADVSAQFGQARKEVDRTASPYRSGSAINDLRANEALAKAGAATNARRVAEVDKSQMLGSALNTSLQTLGS